MLDFVKISSFTVYRKIDVIYSWFEVISQTELHVARPHHLMHNEGMNIKVTTQSVVV